MDSFIQNKKAAYLAASALFRDILYLLRFDSFLSLHLPPVNFRSALLEALF